MRGAVRLRAGSLLGHRRPKGEEGASSYTSLGTPRPAKGTAASTSSQPQAVMDSSADTSAPLASRLAGGENLEKSSSIGHTPSNEAVLTRATPDRNRSAPGAGAPTGDFWERSGQHEPRRVPGRGAPLIEVVFHWAHTFQRSRPHQSDNRHEPKRTGSGCPHRRSGSEADSMSRGGYPVAGRPSSKPSSIRHSLSTKSSSIRHMPLAKPPPQSAVFSFSADTETDAASCRSCPSTSRFVRATDSTKSCHGTSVMPTSPRWPFSPSSHRPVTG